MFKSIIVSVLILMASPILAQATSALAVDRLALANQLAKRGLHAEALREYEAIRGDSSVPRDEVFFRLGEAYRNVKRPTDALAAYAELIAKYPQSRYVDYARLNRALLLKGEARERELAALDHADGKEQVRATALYWLGEAAEARKDAKQAIAWYTKVAEVAPTNDVARLARLKSAALLSASSDRADRRQAQVIYLDLASAQDPSVAEEALFFSGMLSYREGLYDEAARLFRRLSARFPGSDRAQECRIYSAWASHLSGRYTEALELAAPLREQKNEDAYYLVAAALKRLERRDDALRAYDAALAAFPTGRHADAEWFERLAVLAVSGQHRRVLDELSRRPDPPENVADRAWSYGCEAAIAMTNFPRAIELATLVARRTDGKMAPNAVHRLAWLYEKTGDWPRAALAYRRLSDKWPDEKVAAQALYLAGATELKAGRPDQARADWTQLLSRYPESPYAGEGLYARAMEELRKKEFRSADRSLSELARRFPDYATRAETLYWWGIAAKGADDPPEAERHFRAALARQPNAEFEREIKLELAFILQQRGASREAVEIFAGLLETKAVNRLPPNELEWISESMASVTNYAAALSAAKVIERRNVGPDWNQVGATLAGEAHEGLGERDAAMAAYGRALATGAKTVHGVKAALALGRLESSAGLFDEAKAHLSDAVERAHPRELLALRVQAYAALAANEEERGDAAAALGYHMLVGTLFDDPVVVPHALARAIAILRQQGRAKEAGDLEAERKKRYPHADAD